VWKTTEFHASKTKINNPTV